MTISSVPTPAINIQTDSSNSGAFPAVRQSIALASTDAVLVAQLEQWLRPLGFIICGDRELHSAWTVVADSRRDPSSAVKDARRIARDDAAVIAIVERRDHIAPALRAGAGACLAMPLIRDELVAVIRAAAAARTAQLEVADLSRQLDVHTHLASIGRLSAGLSHEIGNPLTAATLSANVLAEDLDAYRRIADALERILAAKDGPALERAREAAVAALRSRPLTDLQAIDDIRGGHARIVDLLTVMQELVGRKPATCQALQLHSIVERVKLWAAQGAAQNVAIETIYEGDVVAVGQVRLIEQILVNLLDNAAHALAGLASARIRLHVYALEDYAVISVRDNGPGIDPAIQAHLFEPFVTSRRGAGGTGLGLALCREYARQIGADIIVSSAVGRGACFRLRLRLAP